MKPIHFASIQGSISTFKVLAKLGSDPRSPTRNVRMKDLFLFRINGYVRMYACVFVLVYIAWKTAHSLCMW